jgi:Uma2 family endonuclease
MIIQAKPRLLTPTEYLDREVVAEVRSEYIDGKIVEMAGGTTNHNEIVTNLCANLKPLLRPKNFRLFTENVRVWIEAYRVYTYPDVMVIAGNPVYHGIGTTTVVNPELIIEVSSRSTKNYDRGDKFDFYRSLDSLQEYVLIDQSRCHVMQFTKTDTAQWLLTDYQDLSASVLFTTLALTVSLDDIYAGVDFALPEAE